MYTTDKEGKRCSRCRRTRGLWYIRKRTENRRARDGGRDDTAPYRAALRKYNTTPLSYSPATLFSSPPLPPPNQTQPSTDDRFLFLPFYLPSSFAPFAPPILYPSHPTRLDFPSLPPPPLHHPLLLRPAIPLLLFFSSLPFFPPSLSLSPSLFSLSLSLSLSLLFPRRWRPLPRYRRTCYRDTLFSRARGEGELCCELPVHTDGYFRSRSKDSRRHRERERKREREDRLANRDGLATPCFSIVRGNRTYRSRSCMPIMSNDR